MQRNTKLMGIEEIEEEGGNNYLMKNNMEDENKIADAEDEEIKARKAPERLNMSTPLLMHQ